MEEICLKNKTKKKKYSKHEFIYKIQFLNWLYASMKHICFVLCYFCGCAKQNIICKCYNSAALFIMIHYT